MRRKPSPPPELIEHLAKQLANDWRLRGKLTREVPTLAFWRLHFRRKFYNLASFNFGISVFNLMVAAGTTGFFHWVNVGSFSVGFLNMFWCEFRARQFTRELNRPANEQVARDILAVDG